MMNLRELKAIIDTAEALGELDALVVIRDEKAETNSMASGQLKAFGYPKDREVYLVFSCE